MDSDRFRSPASSRRGDVLDTVRPLRWSRSWMCRAQTQGPTRFTPALPHGPGAAPPPGPVSAWREAGVPRAPAGVRDSREWAPRPLSLSFASLGRWCWCREHAERCAGSARFTELLVLQLCEVQGPHECFDVGLQLLDLGGVHGPQSFQFRDLLAQSLLAVGDVAARADLFVELVLEVGVALGEGVSGDVGLNGEGDDGQGSA